MRNVSLTNKVTKALSGNSKGFSLIEALIAVSLLGMVAGAYLSGVTTAYKADIVASERTNAESLARSEQEYIKNVAYNWTVGGFSYAIPGTPPSWDPTHTLDSYYAQYSVNVTGVPINPGTHNSTGLDTGMQQITVKVYHQNKLVLTTSNYKVNR